jgi:AhpD family alkylhydroperoxidase
MATNTRVNINATLEKAPRVAEAYAAVAEALERGSLWEAERVTVLLAASFENECDYCVPVYTTLGRKAGMAPKVIEALRAGAEVPDGRLGVVAEVTRALIQNRGRLSPELRGRFPRRRLRRGAAPRGHPRHRPEDDHQLRQSSLPSAAGRDVRAGQVVAPWQK